jgi:outer membrane protein assembly factor BamB
VIDLPGDGVSSPIIWGDRLFVTAADESSLRRALLCYAVSDGKLLWSQAVPFTKEKKHKHNSYATNTPTADTERVYTLWQGKESSQLLAYDHGGKLLWTCEVGPYASGHGGGISPIVVDGIVALNLNHEGDSCMLGVDAATGKIKWRTPRAAVRATYSTPCVFTDAGGRNLLIFTCWRHGMTAVDPQTGKVAWELPDLFDPTDAEDKRAIGSPFVAGGLIYGNCGFVGGKKIVAAVRPPGSADAKPGIVFRLDRNTSHMTTALVVGNLLFMWCDAGILVCSEAATGQTLWQERIGGKFSSSPIAVDGKLYCISDDGEVVVVAAADKFTELGRVALEEGTAATAAVAGETIFFRTFGKLYALKSKRHPLSP